MKDIKSILREMDEYSSTLDDEYAEHALTQLHYVLYAVDEIISCLEDDCMDLPPWYINRISKIHSDVESLHSYLEGKKRKTFSGMGVAYEETIVERKDDPADKDDDASDDDRAAADKNIIMQLRRVADLPKGGTVTFKDNRSVAIKQADAKKALKGFDKLVKGSDKERFQKLAGKSHNDLKKILSVIREENILDVVEGSDKIKGTPVVSLSDFDDKDYKRDKYGRAIPKKLKRNDPRVKFNKERKGKNADLSTIKEAIKKKFIKQSSQ